MQKFKDDILESIALARVLAEFAPESNDTEALREIIRFAKSLVVDWNKVRAVAEECLKFIEEGQKQVEGGANGESMKAFFKKVETSRDAEG